MKYLRFLIALTIFFMPLTAMAAPKKLEVSGWIPYWRTATGTADALMHIDSLTEINPFVYRVKLDGSIEDRGKIQEEPWLTLRAQAAAHRARFIPTVMWGDGDSIHRILSNAKERRALEDRITNLAKEENFDGIDIDFEGKKAETRNYFSTFLKGLHQRMGKKWLMCTIEARTPVEDRYFGTVPPPDAANYANDYKAINRYCDRVRIMAYDQQGIDQTLTFTHGHELYAPVADPEWVEKALRLAMKEIKKSKLTMGVPTYGYEYEVSSDIYGYNYKILWTFNPGYALPLAKLFSATPVRVAGGEIGFSYTPTSTPIALISSSNSGVTTTPIIEHEEVAAGGHVATSSVSNTFRFLSWSDAESLRQKVALAKKLGLRGVAIFKIDGGEDQNIWNVLK